MTTDNPSPNIPIHKGDQDPFLLDFTRMDEQTQKLQNDQHLKFQTHIFFFHSFNLRHEHEHYYNCADC
jgi:hypothetical protein